MAQTLDEKLIQNLVELTLNIDEVQGGKHQRHDILELLITQKVYGPFSSIALASFFDQNPQVLLNSEMRVYGQEKFFPTIETKKFQRRKEDAPIERPELNKGINTYLLIEGQKKGPFQVQEVHQLLIEKKIIFTDLICTDEDPHWCKIYEYPDFDRRRIQAQENLPHQPAGEVFHHSSEVVAKELSNTQQKEQKEAAMAILAQASHLGELKRPSRASGPTDEKQEEEQVLAKAKVTERIMYASIAVVAIIAITSFFIFQQAKKEAKLANKVNQENLRAPVSVTTTPSIKKAKIVERFPRPKAPEKNIGPQYNDSTFQPEGPSSAEAPSDYEKDSPKQLSENPLIESDPYESYYDNDEAPELEPTLLNPEKSEANNVVDETHALRENSDSSGQKNEDFEQFTEGDFLENEYPLDEAE